jgi:hypothetical protein
LTDDGFEIELINAHKTLTTKGGYPSMKKKKTHPNIRPGPDSVLGKPIVG